MGEAGRARLFVAAWPPAALADELAGIARDVAGARWLPVETLHVTLRFLGDASPNEVGDALSAATFTRGTAQLELATSWLGRDSLVVRVRGVDDLAARVRAATASVCGTDRSTFRGHITLARVRGRDQEAARHALVGLPTPARTSAFDVSEVTLVRSNLTPRGAIYEVIRRYPCVDG